LLLGVAPRLIFPDVTFHEGDNAREILVFAAATKIVARCRERSAAAECIKLAIKSGGDNRNKAAMVNQLLGPVPFHVQRRNHALGWLEVQGTGSEGINREGELSR